MSEERICGRFRCEEYKKGNVSPIGITNCTSTAWRCTCRLWCVYRNYALSLNPSSENQNGTYSGV